MGQFEIYDDDGAPIQLNDTIIYGEDGSSIKFQASDAFDPITGEPCKKLTVTSYNADGTKNSFFITEAEKRGDTVRYGVEPFTLSKSLFVTLLDVATSKEDTVYQIVDEMPQFPGGENALMEYVSKNVVYPEEAKEKEIQGRVFISFVVEKDGSIGEVKVLRGIGGGCDEESVRVISDMPRWKPGKQKGKAVRVSYQIPIMFKLGQTNDEYKTTVKTVIAGDGDYSYKASTATVPDNPAKANMKPDKDGVYQIVDEMPEFPGGVEALMDYVSRNVKYPESAKENNLQGRVLVKFVIEKDGSVSNVEVGRGWGNELDDEAVRVVKAMPKWKPGKQDGQPVRVSFMLPINFKLSDGTPSKGSLMGTTWTGTATGKKGKVTYELSWTINFTDGHDGIIMMTLWSKEKKGEKKVKFDDVPLPFEYTYDGKSTGSINPVNPDNSPMSETPIPPYGFVINPDNTMRINVFDSKEDFGIGEIVVKKQK
jgi:TonB family protein